MAAVAPLTSVGNGAYDPENDQHTEHGPPRFTAVNGKEAASHSPGVPNAAANSTNIDDEHAEVVEGNRNPNGYQNSSSSRTEQRPLEGLHSNLEQDDSHSQRSSSQPYTGPNKNKRKRSESTERQSSHQEVHIQEHAPRRSEGNIELPIQSAAANESNPVHAAHDHPSQAPSEYTRAGASEEPRVAGTNGSWQDYDSHLVSQAQKAQSMDTSDVQLAEALQREAHATESIEQRAWSAGRVSGSSEIDQQSFAPYSSDKPQSAVQVGPKRKRVFSNRTKTGCMTCRRRKKKCDEQHPACNNCLRGGFVCEGYSSRSTWQKPSGTKGPIPLQSKDGYSEASNHFIQDANAQRHDRASAQQAEMNKVRSIVVDDHDRPASQYIGSPTNVGTSRGSWSKRSWPGTAHPSYLAEHMTKSDYREVPPIHELSREGQPKADYHVPSIREFSQQGSHPKPGMPIFAGGVDQRPSHANAMDTNSPQTQARMALSIEHQLSARPNAGEETERDKMIHGELYRPFDIQLVEDRDRCKAALWRFNNACNPLSGVSSKEQNRLLREVIIPPVAASPSASPGARPTGSIGQGAVVEAPFRCHYGFNIHIGEDVMISENCSLVDDCPINIGAHTWIGPNVTILSSMAHANMQERKGSQSRYQGRSVTIEEDCYVGANCTIYPGVRLRRGAYVAPGEVVKTDIVAYGFQGLKPSYM